MMTGSVVLGGAVALIEPLFNTVAYHYHEKAWDWFRGRPQAGPGRGVALQG